MKTKTTVLILMCVVAVCLVTMAEAKKSGKNYKKTKNVENKYAGKENAQPLERKKRSIKSEVAVEEPNEIKTPKNKSKSPPKTADGVVSDKSAKKSAKGKSVIEEEPQVRTNEENCEKSEDLDQIEEPAEIPAENVETCQIPTKECI